jgi:hypothetical protein
VISDELRDLMEQFERYGPCPEDVKAVLYALEGYHDDRVHMRSMLSATKELCEAVLKLTEGA